MRTINVMVRDKIASAVGDIVYICDNSDYIINFDFDAEWDAYGVKTARFVHNGTYTDVVFTGNQCAMPVIHKAYGIFVGVYAGDLHTTTPVHIPSAASILSDEGTPEEPSDDVYAQITALCNEAVAEATSVREDADAGKFDGAPGKTPEVGVDYFTEADKQAIAAEAAQKVGFPQPTSADNGKYLGCENGAAVWKPVEASGGTDVSLGLTSVKIGQTIKVKAVDENGKPTEWEAAELYKDLPLIFSRELTEPATALEIYTDSEGNALSLNEWDIFVHIPGTTTQKTTLYVYVVDRDFSGVTFTFAYNDRTALNLLRYRSVKHNYTEVIACQYAGSTKDKVYMKYYPEGVNAKSIRMYTYNEPDIIPAGTIVEVYGK